MLGVRGEWEGDVEGMGKAELCFCRVRVGFGEGKGLLRFS